MATIKELAERKALLEAQLARVKAQIASRAGEVDDDQEPAAPAKKTAAKKTSAKK